MQTLGNRRHVQQAQDQVKQAHMDYCAAVHPDIQVGASSDGSRDGLGTGTGRNGAGMGRDAQALGMAGAGDGDVWWRVVALMIHSL